MTRASPWWAKDVYADRKPFLAARTAVAGAIRHFFARERFVEVETAALQFSGGNETHISPFGVELIGPGGDKVGFICIPRRNSPARSCWRRARSAFSRSPACFATASARRSTIPSSRCSNGIAPMNRHRG